MSIDKSESEKDEETARLCVNTPISDFYDLSLWDRVMMVKSENGRSMNFVPTSFSISAMNKLKEEAEPTIVGKDEIFTVLFHQSNLIVTGAASFLRCTNCYVRILSTATKRRWPLRIIADNCMIEGFDVDVIFEGYGKNVHLFEGANIQYMNGAERFSVGRVGVSPTGRQNNITVYRSHVTTSSDRARIASRDKFSMQKSGPKKRSPTRVAKLF
jgi:hypothetical protein